MRSRRVRDSTSQLYRSALLDFTTFCKTRGLPFCLPANPLTINAFISHCVTERDLATSTIDTRIAALRAWHRRQAEEMELLNLPVPADPLDSGAVKALLSSVRRRHGRPSKARRPLSRPEFESVFLRGFDLSTAHGLHHRLCFMMLTLGCLRRKAAAHLRVSYTVVGRSVFFDAQSDVRVLFDSGRGESYIQLRVDTDKNVHERDAVLAYIPERFKSLSVRPVDVLLDYLRRVRPPSGSYLLAAPRSRSLPGTSFFPTPYGGMCAAFKQAVRRASPGAGDERVALVGSHSGRKSLAQWLWDDYGSLRLVCDVGHWKCRGDAANLYFVSSRSVILQCLTEL